MIVSKSGCLKILLQKKNRIRIRFLYNDSINLITTVNIIIINTYVSN